MSHILVNDEQTNHYTSELRDRLQLSLQPARDGASVGAGGSSPPTPMLSIGTLTRPPKIFGIVKRKKKERRERRREKGEERRKKKINLLDLGSGSAPAASSRQAHSHCG